MQARQKKLLPLLLVFGFFTFIVTCINLLNFIIAFASGISGTETLLLNSGKAAWAFIIMPFIGAFLYLLFSALAHFSVWKAVGLWLAEIPMILVCAGAIRLVIDASYWVIALLILLAVVPVGTLLIVAIVKREIQIGWWAAVLLLVFWSGAAIIFAYTGTWESVLYLYGCFPFIGFVIFILVDLRCIVRSVRRERIAAAT